MNQEYLELLRRTLTGEIYDDGRCLPMPARRFLRTFFPNVMVSVRVSPEARKAADYWPYKALTMIGETGLSLFESLITEVVKNKVSGDIVECGVWRGGACIYAAAVLKTLGERRKIYMCDSFAGLPKPTVEQDKDMKLHLCDDVLAVPIEIVKANLQKYRVLSDDIHFVQGFFCDTLPKFPGDRIAVLRADGDMYTSTRDILVNLYPKVQSGGYVIIDDYNAMKECNAAVDEYIAPFKDKISLKPIYDHGIYWKKP